MYIRLSRGKFDDDTAAKVEAVLKESEEYLVPGLRKLTGLINYYAGLADSRSMVNISTWETEENAKQMDDFEPMKMMRQKMIDLKVQFDPIVNYEILWRI